MGYTLPAAPKITRDVDFLCTHFAYALWHFDRAPVSGDN